MTNAQYFWRGILIIIIIIANIYTLYTLKNKKNTLPIFIANIIAGISDMCVLFLILVYFIEIFNNWLNSL